MRPLSSGLRIALVGPCGVGKSTLARAFVNMRHIHVVHERPPSLVSDVSNYSDLDVVSLQVAFFRMRMKQLHRSSASILVFDRTIDEDRHVFLRLHCELGGLTESQRLRLDGIAQRVERRIGSADVTVILYAEPHVLRQRIANEKRPEWLQKSLERQLELYDDLEATIKGPVLEVDMTRGFPNVVLRSMAKWIAETAATAAGKSQLPVNHQLSLHWSWR